MSTRARIALLSAAVLASGGLALVLAARDSLRAEAASSHRPTSFSYLPLGHRAFRSLLQEAGHPTVASQHNSVARAYGGLLVLAEPAHLERDIRFVSMLDTGCDTMLVLPKWSPPDSGSPGKPVIHLAGADSAAFLLSTANLPFEVVRVEDPEWRESALGPAPVLVAPAQLIKLKSDNRREVRFVPLLEASEGVLAGIVHRPRQSLLLLSDPDLISNYGLRRGSNGELAVALIRSLAADDAPVVFDETLHGLYGPPSLIEEATTFPLSLALAQALLLFAGLIWYAALRFGRPLPVKAGMEAGKRMLLDNLGSLQSMQANAVPAVRRYLEHAMREAAAVHLPRDRGDPAMRMGALDQIARRRGTADSPSDLSGEVEELRIKQGTASEALRLARKIRRWHQEMMNGTRRTT